MKTKLKLKQTEYYKIVTRQGEVPTEDEIRDMLRYDLAFIHRELPGIAAFPSFNTKAGRLGGRVSERWQSFGVHVIAIPDDDEPPVSTVNLSLELKPDDWITYRHPTLDDTRVDYTRIEPRTLRQFIEEYEARGY